MGRGRAPLTKMGSFFLARFAIFDRFLVGGRERKFSAMCHIRAWFPPVRWCAAPFAGALLGRLARRAAGSKTFEPPMIADGRATVKAVRPIFCPPKADTPRSRRGRALCPW